MLRRPSPPAPRRRPVQAHVRTGVALLLLLASPVARAAAADHRDLRDLVGQVLYVKDVTTVRTVGGGLAVDFGRGQSVVLVSVGGDRAVLAPGQAEASLLRAHGVRKPPRYAATTAQLAADFVTAAVWEKTRDTGVRRILDRWPELSSDRAGQIYVGQPFVGMTEEQAEEAVGPLVLARAPSPTDPGTTVWKVGRRPRASELRLYTEARERGSRSRTFDEFLARRTRALVSVKDGVVVAIAPPEGQTAGLNWP